MEPQQPHRDEFWWANPQLKEQLQSDPVAILKDRGINPPDNLPLPVVHEFIRVAHLLWVNGKIIPIDEFYIDPADEGLLFGRGVWESTRTSSGIPWLWSLHLDRLQKSAELLNIEITPDRLPQSQQVTEYVRTLTKQDVILRLNVSAGRPGKPGIVWMSASPQVAHSPTITLKSCRSPVEKGQAYLTLKTFQYATRLRIGQQAALAGYDSALLLDAVGNIQEASHANIFFRFPDGWVTPIADGGLLPGTVRQFLLKESPFPIREAIVPLSKLNEVREAFVTNSNVGIVPVSQIDGNQFAVGEETGRLIKWLMPPNAPGVQYRFVNRVPTPR